MIISKKTTNTFQGLILFFASIAIISCTKQYPVKVKGEIANAAGEKIFFQHVKTDKTETLDSLELDEKGQFKFKTNSKYPSFYQLKIGAKGNISLLLQRGEKVSVKADADNLIQSLVVEGSVGSEQLHYLNTELFHARKKLDILLADSTSTIEEALAVMNAHRKNMIQFIMENSSSLASISAIYQQYSNNLYVFNSVRDLQYFKILSDSLSNYHPQSAHVRVLKGNAKAMIDDYQLASLMNAADEVDTNALLPDISLHDTKGKETNLHEFRGKTVLLTFWSHQNEESVRYNLSLKPIYQKHKKNFEIYAVSVSNDSAGWQAAIRFDDLEWTNVRGSEDELNYYLELYNVSALPQSYLISSDKAVILGKNVSASEIDNFLNDLSRQNAKR
jgi:hypothetical protein